MTAAIAEMPCAESMSEPPLLPKWEHRSELTLAALPSAVGCARLLVRRFTFRFQIGEEVAVAVAQITDELVFHSVATTGVTKNAPLYTDAFNRLGLLCVRLRCTPQQVIVEVWDRGELPPHPRLSQSPVIQAAHDWGFELPSHGQRVVWCVVPLAEPRDDQQTVLPRRVGQRVPRTAGIDSTEGQPDLTVLQRVLDGLRVLGPNGGPDAC